MSRWLSITDTAKSLGVSERTIYRLMEQDKLHPVKIGKSWKFEESDLDAYVEEQRKESARILKEKRQSKDQESKNVA